MIYEIQPHNGRKSFYGKARVEELNSVKTLISYQTKVCRIDENGHFIKLWNGYSVTTMNHINAFRIMNGLETMGKKEWEGMATEEQVITHSDMTPGQSYKAMISRRYAG